MKRIKSLSRICIFCVLFLSACRRDLGIYLEEHETADAKEAVTETLSEPETENDGAEGICYVYLCGAVVRPGVYALPDGSRIYEVIEQAGGLLPEADPVSVNQAEPVTDGQMVRVALMGEVQETELEEAQDGRVDVNTADKKALMTLPGIGASRAEAILAYREENGRFSSIEELKKVAGIKDGIFEQIKEHIKVRN